MEWSKGSGKDNTLFGHLIEACTRQLFLQYYNLHLYVLTLQQVDLTTKLSSKGKVPWISYNDEVIEDSNFCIEYLDKKFGIDLNQHLSPESKAIGRAFQKMVEENTYWFVTQCSILYLQ